MGTRGHLLASKYSSKEQHDWRQDGEYKDIYPQRRKVWFVVGLGIHLIASHVSSLINNDS